MSKLIDDADYRCLAGVLADARYEAHLTQAELGTRIGKTQKFVSLVENAGRVGRRIDLLELLAFEHALGFEPLALIQRIYDAVILDRAAREG